MEKEKYNKKFVVSIAVVLVIGILAIILYKPILEAIYYKRAEAAMESFEYENAIQILSKIEDNQAEKLIQECNYLNAQKELNNGEYENAINEFSELGDYRDAEIMIKECKYQLAEEYSFAQEYKLATDIYLEILEYKDSKSKAQDITYYLIKEFVDHEEYYDAINLVKDSKALLEGHQESEELEELIRSQSEWFNEKGDNEYIKGNFEKAHDYYRYIRGSTKVREEKMTKCEIMMDFQGEYTCRGIGDNRKAKIDKFVLNMDGIEYIIEPVIRYTDKELGITEEVGILNGDSEHYIETTGEGRFLCWNRNLDPEDEDRVSGWATEEGIRLEEERIRKAEEEERKREQEYLANEPHIGMTRQQLENSNWGKPQDINKTTYSWGVKEQWCYWGDRYVYLEDGIVTAIRE